MIKLFYVSCILLFLVGCSSLSGSQSERYFTFVDIKDLGTSSVYLVSYHLGDITVTILKDEEEVCVQKSEKFLRERGIITEFELPKCNLVIGESYDVVVYVDEYNIFTKSVVVSENPFEKELSFEKLSNTKYSYEGVEYELNDISLKYSEMFGIVYINLTWDEFNIPALFESYDIRLSRNNFDVKHPKEYESSSTYNIEDTSNFYNEESGDGTYYFKVLIHLINGEVLETETKELVIGDLSEMNKQMDEINSNFEKISDTEFKYKNEMYSLTELHLDHDVDLKILNITWDKFQVPELFQSYTLMYSLDNSTFNYPSDDIYDDIITNIDENNVYQEDRRLNVGYNYFRLTVVLVTGDVLHSNVEVSAVPNALTGEYYY
jgi:hypothetical protein